MAEKKMEMNYDAYVAEMRRIADIRFAAALLQWDQEVYLPPKGAAFRGQQIATLSEMAHQLFTGDRIGGLLQELLGDPALTHTQKRNVELTWNDYSKQKKLSSGFVRRLTETVHRSFHSWIEARKANDFRIFSKDLAAIADLKKQEAELLGYSQHPYDALLDDYDKGSTVQMLDGVFGRMKAPLKELIDKIGLQPDIDDSFLRRHYARDQQWAFGMELLKELGYDFEAGRQDLSEHPFTTNFNSRDVRITTRIDENNLSSMTWSCIHELGHALYEQGLPETEYGLPLGEPASIAIHESQSRLWENHVGRSWAFCQRYFPVLQQDFPEALDSVTLEAFYRGINKVQPSLVRTEADEVTYHFHVIIRYELEKQLMEGALPVSDIPAWWNEQYDRYLGVRVPDDKQGCLQDVHWSHGSFGYFPTYSLGSFYAAQFFATAAKILPDLDLHIREGDTRSLLEWLRTRLHRLGRMYTSEAMCLEITGEPLNVQYFLDYLDQKYRDIYKF